MASKIATEQFRTDVKNFQSSIGPRAEVFVSVSLRPDTQLYNASLYSRGITSRSEMDFRVDADSLTDLLEGLKSKWTEMAERHRAAITRKMALAIIRITAELGECTDAALRNCGEFDPAQIKMYGEQACADANDIAGRGPFAIVTMGGANAETEAA